MILEEKAHLTASYVRVPDLETTPTTSACNPRTLPFTSPLTDLALLEDVSRHDAHLAPLADDPRTVAANHPTLALALERIHHPDLVPLRDPLRDGHNELDLRLDSLNDGVRGTCGRHVDDGRVGLGFAHGVADGTEDGEAEVGLAGFLRV